MRETFRSNPARMATQAEVDVDWQWTNFEGLDSSSLYGMLQLRQAVFVVEQDCPYLDADGEDYRAWHLLGRQEGELVAYLRAFAPGLQRVEAVIGRVITSERLRGQGWGRPLMQQGMERCAETFGRSPIFVSAQAHLEPYYGSLGFVTSGPGYDEDGIPHLPMICP